MITIKNKTGFTLLEIMVAVAIVAIIAAVAVPAYRIYIEKSIAAEFMVKYEALRVALISNDEETDACSDYLKTISQDILHSEYALLDIGFERVQGGYTPFLKVCSEASVHGKRGIGVVTRAYDQFVHNGVKGDDKGTLLGESLVSYTIPLLPGKTVLCENFIMQTTTTPISGCGGAGGFKPVLAPKAPSIVAPPVPQAPLAPKPLPVKIPKIEAYVMKFSGTNTYVRPAGEILNTNGPLDAFTVEMSFIGDPNIAAASGGQGPVMFNYGDSSNSHNAISLWNPKSLTVALLGQNLDTGINVADGQTHRVSVSWDSKTGHLMVLDNGQVAKEWDNIKTGQTIPGDGHMVVAHKSNGDGTYNPGEAFTGQIFSTAVAREAVSADELAKPLNQVLDSGSGLLADFQVAGGTVSDMTGRHTVESGGMTPTLTGVDGNLINTP